MNQIENIIVELRKSIESQKFKGYDPYDCLNIDFFHNIRIKWIRLFFTVFFRFSPINFRPFFGMKRSYNPKALAILLSSYINLYKLEFLDSDKAIKQILYKLLISRSKGYSGFCCGYNFPWQNRERLLPAFTPTLVNTVYASHALFDYFELTGDERLKNAAISSCDFIIQIMPTFF